MENITTESKKPRMLILMRNSTKKQAQKIVMDDGHVEYDIPLQRSILRPWGERLGYEVLKEELVEGGVSGYKVSADKRDEITRLKEMADKHEFEVLGIYMSDRLGRIADETPLIVSYLNARGIKVLSYSEGEISSRTHNDKLMTYIRYWQAEGESIKTSMRTRDANEKNVEQGRWRGGTPPYGYRTVSNGTLNFRGRPIFDVEIDPETSQVVKKIFKLYKEHYSSVRIAKILNDEGIPTRNGALWATNTITKILRNKMYIGLYELGKASKNIRTVSPIMENMRLIDEQTFDEVQDMITQNKLIKDGKRPTVRGAMLLTGLLYCECGKKYTGHTQVYKQERKDGSTWEYECRFYRCGSHRLPKTGQCNKKPFKADKLEKLITDDAKKFLLETDVEKLLINQEEKTREKEREMIEQSKRIGREKAQKEKELAKLKEEVYKVIIGESQFSKELLSDIIETKEKELNEMNLRDAEIESRIGDLRALLSQQRTLSGDLTDWSKKFDLQELDEKKTMLINLINKITVFDEKIEVNYRIRFENFDEMVYNDSVNSDNGGSVCNIVQNGASGKILDNFLCNQFAQSATLATICHTHAICKCRVVCSCVNDNVFKNDIMNKCVFSFCPKCDSLFRTCAVT